MANQNPWKFLYNRAQWKRLRLQQLATDPLCAFCLADNRVTEADTVDHVIAHRGDEDKFFDADNLQSLCAPCHSSHKQRLENRNVEVIGCAETGEPLDPNHHWNQ